MSTEQATSDSVTPVQEENAEKAESVHTYHTSTSSSAAARKEAKAYAAKVKLQFAEMEAEMKRKQAAIAFNEAKMKKEREDLTVEQELLSCRKEVAVAEAEASAYNILDAPSKANSKVDSFIRTKSFVDADNNFRLANTVPKQTLNHDAPDFVPNYTSFHQTVPPDFAPIHTSTQQPAARDPYVTDFTRYLLKKDLLLSRLTCFDDKPENYRTWKVSFKTVMNELNVSSLEELDMLVKWTGPESKKQVLNIKAANVENPIVGLTKAWNRLEERYGCPEMLESSIKKRLDSFPKLNVKDVKKLYELSDLVSEIECLKGQSNLCALFSYFDSSTGVNHIVSKLPYYLQQKWTTYAVKYMEDRGVVYPPFAVFAKFLQEQSRIRNNPSFIYDSTHFSGKKDQSPVSGIQKQLIVKKTGLKSTASSGDDKVVKCPLHHTAHSINKCRAFLAKTFADRIKYLREKNICLRCCESDSHWKKDCTTQIKCTICNSDTHTAALHKDKPTRQMPVNKGQSGEETLLKSEHVGNEGGERSTPHAFNQFVTSNVQKPPAVDSMNISSACTRICGDANGTGKSCAKIVLGTVHVANHEDIAVKVYIIIDDQSNQSLGSTQLFDQLGVAGNETEYILTSCAGQYRASGRKLHNLVIDSYNQSARLVIPTVTECNYLPSNKDEIPTPEIALSYPHLQDIASEIPLFDSGTDIMLLIGRDVIRAHHVIDQRVGPANTPYAQQLCLGWTIIGESCLGNCHLPNVVNVKKTNLLPNGRESILQPCSSVLKVKEVEPIGHNVFIRTSEDEKPGLSRDDRSFLNIMSNNFNKDEEGHWICPLPLREDRPRLANDYPLALKRAQMLDQSLRKDPIKRDHFITFMDKMLRNAHAERAPELREDEECWYIPIFGIYHPHKPGNIRIVFDSAVKYNGISLNDVLYTGPDLTNSLLGILMRFRREPVAVIADIEQMFYCFRVNVEHRNLLRFIWHEDNDFSKPLVDYRMCVHIFGSTSSPAIATYGLRKAASLSSRGSDVTDFVHNEFYVDDSLISLQTSEQAVDLITRTQQVLQNEGKLRLHKIASNNIDVMNAFPTADLSKDIKDLDLGSDSLPTQRSLGITWSLDSDMFMFHVSEVKQSFTRRGILSTVNSLFDPLGFLAPVVIEGKILLRNLVQGTTDWDEPLSPQLLDVWENWTSSLKHLQDIKIPRMILSGSFTAAEHKTVHIFCDASEEAISSVGYLQAMVHNDIQLGFIIGKAKVAPSHGHTVPRLELCSAVLAVEIAELISSHLQLPIDNFKFYSDSRIVLGYLNNTSRRFYTYVTNRVHRILSSTKPEQWFYVSSENNPADKATRPISASELPNCAWLNGPSFLKQGESSDNSASFALQDPDRDKEVRPEIKTLKTELGSDSLNLGSHRFERFSNWRKLIRAVSCLQHIAQTFHGDKCSNGWHTCDESHTVHALSAILFLFPGDTISQN
ncbi:hypothetical protein FSP39_016350 [Pinctada imbricata]|uniref:Peptidase aspartic putative domain-containing protein n=1 Tax=Pinctada imbricata TaxID=66713 RepID=A0AA88XML7_PINIB|nr:hypothetical protein FSP39_016350 [Pinctada imbricata]